MSVSHIVTDIFNSLYSVLSFRRKLVNVPSVTDQVVIISNRTSCKDFKGFVNILIENVALKLSKQIFCQLFCLISFYSTQVLKN